MDSKTDHVWHVWINQESDRLREWQAANPSGEVTTDTRRGKPVETPVPQRTPLDLIDPHERGLYDFKSAMQTIPWLTRVIGMERKKTLPLVHQQCSHSPPEPIKEEFLTCAFGKKLRECPILQRLRESVFEQQKRHAYYRSIDDEKIDGLQAMTCVWHMLMGHDGVVDWNEGAVQSVSDRMFWNRVYERLSMTPEEGPAEIVGPKTEKCSVCGVDFREFPEMYHEAENCPGPECTCYEVIGGHQPGCPLAKR